MPLNPPSRREFLQAAAALAVRFPADGPPADDPASWAQFLGPRRDGISRETGLNTDWTKKKPAVVWKAATGPSFSSVSVVGDRLFTGEQRGSRDGILCIDAKKGKERWYTDAAPGYLDRQRQGAGPRATPTFHRGRLYVLMANGALLCLEADDGKKVWEVDLFDAAKTRPRDDVYYWGMAGSPLVEGDLVIVQPGGNRDNSLVALRRDTGRLAWGVGNDPAGYSSPIAIEAGGRRQIVSFTGRSAIGVDPAAGKLLWRFELGNEYDCNIATPLWAEGLLFISAAYKTGSAALELTASGPKVKWQDKVLMNHFPTSVIAGGHVYGCHGDLAANMLKAVELATGKEKWFERGTGKCSLLGLPGHLVLLGERGTVWLIEANPDAFVVKGKLEGLLGTRCWSQPAFLDKKLYLRDERQIVQIDLAE